MRVSRIGEPLSDQTRVSADITMKTFERSLSNGSSTPDSAIEGADLASALRRLSGRLCAQRKQQVTRGASTPSSDRNTAISPRALSG